MGFPTKANNYGWRGNALGLQRWEVECAHKARLDATEAVADLMRRGKSFAEAKAIIEKRAASVYKHSRPALAEGYRRCVGDVQAQRYAERHLPPHRRRLPRIDREASRLQGEGTRTARIPLVRHGVERRAQEELSRQGNPRACRSSRDPRIAEAAFRRRSLSAVAAAVHRPPVRSVPEQAHIALVRDAMVHHVCGPAAAARAPVIAWQGKECLRCRLPIPRVSALAG